MWSCRKISPSFLHKNIFHFTLIGYHQRTCRPRHEKSFRKENLMITQVYPKDFQRFLSLPVLGPWMDSYAAWLHKQQYTHRSSRYELRMAARVSEFLKRRGFQRVEDIGQHDLQACYQWFRRKFPGEEGGVRVLERFLVEKALLHPLPVPEPSPQEDRKSVV